MTWRDAVDYGLILALGVLLTALAYFALLY